MGNICCAKRERHTLENPKQINSIWENYAEQWKYNSEEVSRLEESSIENLISEWSDVGVIKEILEHDLITEEGLSSNQKTLIDNLIQSHKNEINESEIFDSLVEVYIYEKHCQRTKNTLLLTSHSLYITEFNEFTETIRRISISHIKFFWISEEIDTLLIVVDPGKDLCFKSDYIKDIIKALEEITFDLEARLIPWYTEGALSTLLMKLNAEDKVKIEEIYSTKEKFKVYQLLLYYGEPGENILYLELSMKSPGFSEVYDMYFLLTDIAIYSLDIEMKFISKIHLKEIKAIGIYQRLECLIISTSYNKIMCVLPNEYTEYIKSAANRYHSTIEVSWINDNSAINEFLCA